MRKEYPQPKNTFTAIVEFGIKSADVEYVKMFFALRYPLAEISGNPDVPEDLAASMPSGLKFNRKDFFSIKESTFNKGEKIFNYAAKIDLYDSMSLRLCDLQFVEANDSSSIEFVNIHYDNGAIQFINRRNNPAIFDGSNVYNPSEMEADMMNPSNYIYFHNDRLVVSDKPIDEEGYVRKELGHLSDIANNNEEDGSVEIVEDSSTVSDFFEPVEVKTKDDKVIKYDFSKINNGGYTS